MTYKDKKGGNHIIIPGLDPNYSYSSRLSARSALYTEFHLLLNGAQIPLSSPEYRALVLQQNCLARPSVAARQKLWEEIKARYRLNSNDPFFGGFWAEWRRCASESERGLTAYLLFALNDRLVTDLGIEWLFLLLRRAPAEIRVADVLAFIQRAESSHPEVQHWSSETRLAVSQKYTASIRDFGLAKGGVRKITVRPALYGAPVRLLIRALRLSGLSSLDLMRATAFRLLGMEMRRRVKEQLKKMGGLEYWDTSFSYIDRGSGQETFVPVPEMGGGTIIGEGALPPGSVYTIGTDLADNRLALFLLQAQMNRGSGRIIPLGNLSSKMKEAIKTADAYLKANLKNLGIDYDLKAYDFSIQAINLNQSKEGAETAVAFFISMVSTILGKPVLDRTVVLGEMSVQGMLLKVNALPERMQLAVEAGAKRILIPSENKRDLPEVPDAILTAIQWQFYDSPTRAAIMAMGMA